MILLAFCPREIAVPDRGETIDALDRKWALFAEALGAAAVFLPNRPNALEATLDRVSPDAVVLTGGGDVSAVSGAPSDRDACETIILDWAVSRDRPGIGVCRGFQAMLSRYGIPLVRTAGHVGTRHDLRGLFGREVNSFHEFAAINVGPRVRALARAPDGTVEAASFGGSRLAGMMWHPEREWPFGAADLGLFRSWLGTTT